MKSISQSKKLSSLRTHAARLLFTWLIPNLDKNGCFSGESDVIKGLIFTRLSDTIEEIESYLIDLEETGLIVRYEVNGDKFLNVPDFIEKQPSTFNPDREGKSNIPLPSPDLIQSNSRLNPSKYNISKSKLKEDKNAPNDKNLSKPPSIFFDFDSQLWEGITVKDKALWIKTYLACDIDQELLRMGDWLISNPTKRKSNYRKFISNWLSRQQDRGGSKKGGSGFQSDADEWARKRMQEDS